MEKIKLFTHTDLDGVGCAILAKIGLDNVDIEYCNYDDINEKVRSFWFSNEILKGYSCVYITDISISEDLAERIDSDIKLKNRYTFHPKIQLIDHHKTALRLNKYDWCNVKVEDESGLCSGTSLFEKELFYFVGGFSCREQFVEIVRRYDTWEFKTKYNDEEPKRWNDLLYILGRDKFIETIMFKLTEIFDLGFSELEEWALQQRQNEIDKYIESKNKQLIKTTIDGYNAGIVFAERFTSELGNKLCELNPDVDFVAIINPSHSVSYRTVKDIDLSEIAKMYGGGGHCKASGSPILDEQRNRIINLLFGG